MIFKILWVFMFLFKSVFITLLHLRLRDRPHPGWIWALLLTQIFLGLTFTHNPPMDCVGFAIRSF
jgi:uncharacterized membrane protein HdeD (DUF308 family)